MPQIPVTKGVENTGFAADGRKTRRPVRAGAAIALVLVLVLLGCRCFDQEIPLYLELPALPPHWQRCFAEFSWRVVVPAPGSCRQLAVEDAETPRILLPKIQHQPLLAFPLAEGGSCLLPPAGAVFPLDLDTDGCTLILRWEQGPAADLLQRLIRQGVEVDTLNAPRLCCEIAERLPEDPWRMDLDLASERLAGGSFRVTDLRPLPSRTVQLAVGPGLWFLESPFFEPVALSPEELAAGGLLTLPETPLGFHRLFELQAGWVADLWVGQRETLLIPAPGEVEAKGLATAACGQLAADRRPAAGACATGVPQPSTENAIGERQP